MSRYVKSKPIPVSSRTLERKFRGCRAKEDFKQRFYVEDYFYFVLDVSGGITAYEVLGDSISKIVNASIANCCKEDFVTAYNYMQKHGWFDVQKGVR